MCNRYRTSSSPNSILSVTPADSSPPHGFQRGGSQVGFTSDNFKGVCNDTRKAPQPVVYLKSSPQWNLPGCAVRKSKMVDSSMTKTMPIADLRGKITLWTILLERFTMKFWEVSTWHRFQNSNWHDCWPGHKPSRSPSLEVHLARRKTYQGASFSSSIATHSNPLLGAGFKVELF